MNEYIMYGFLDEIEKISMSEDRVMRLAERVGDQFGLHSEALGGRVSPRLKDEEEERAGELIRQKARFATRHPVLTGIPTLGIWPAVQTSNLLKRVAKRLRKEYPEIDERVDQAVEAETRRQERLAEVLRERVSQEGKNERMNAALTTAIIALPSVLGAYESAHRKERSR